MKTLSPKKRSFLTILTAQPTFGKTQAAHSLAGERAVWIVPSEDQENKLVKNIPWVPVSRCTPQQLKKLSRFLPVRLVFSDSDSARLEELLLRHWHGKVFVFDDFPQLFYTVTGKNNFTRFLAGIRHKKSSIIITTQRIQGVLPPFCRVVADTVVQVGPLVERDEARNLFNMGGGCGFESFRNFYQSISKNPPYKKFTVKRS